jgi:hypothetical protein
MRRFMVWMVVGILPGLMTTDRRMILNPEGLLWVDTRSLPGHAGTTRKRRDQPFRQGCPLDQKRPFAPEQEALWAWTFSHLLNHLLKAH